MRDKVSLPHLKMVEQRHLVANHLHHAVFLDGAGLVGITQPAKVRGDRPIPGRREGIHLMTPELMAVRPAVQKQDRRALPGIGCQRLAH
jgi:hypothetical protein